MDPSEAVALIVWIGSAIAGISIAIHKEIIKPRRERREQERRP